ncbi:dicarboxylate/amino acid:cation symporter [Cytobacillus horneckiae]|uniref:dicarboxylate/amino acid:cation symporter n=1 Tax=Cytobacillus horneckiae TaxID=549687 RepID=UPI00203CBC33|nr:dicarboxylate/amino acid:cation symporter [Cytobacillus horneckiae]MCM3180503.1 dicarboxylate/amino acid:cation symporter [Cytobacillus horneckiae]
MKNLGLLPKIILAIALGILIGSFAPESVIKIFSTFNGLFGNFLGFIIPLIIIGFIAPGIGTMGRGAGKLLGISTGLAYASTILAGLLALFVANSFYPVLLKNQTLNRFGNPEEALLKPYFSIEMTPIMDVMAALMIAFIIGLGLAAIKGEFLQHAMEDFRSIIEKVIAKVIIPLLPIHIFGIFSNMTQGGQVGAIISVFAKVFVMIIGLHMIFLLIQYSFAGALAKKNPVKMLKEMLPAYFTALGTQSSASSIPITIKHAKKLGASEKVTDFSIPLLANIHLSGSTITLVSCSVAVLMLQGQSATLAEVLPFILMLGVTMIAAPGVPGGAVMAALGLLESMLGFDATMVALMIALYMAQDSFGTACNVAGDGAIAVMTDKLSKKEQQANHTAA